MTNQEPHTGFGKNFETLEDGSFERRERPVSPVILEAIGESIVQHADVQEPDQHLTYSA